MRGKFYDQHYVPEMYRDSFYPGFLVDKVKSALKKVVEYFNTCDYYDDEEIQDAFDAAISEINDLQREFDMNGSELETVARDSIHATVGRIIEHFELDKDVDDATGQIAF